MLNAPNPLMEISPAARSHLVKNKLFVKDIKPTGRRGLLLKQDIIMHLKNLMIKSEVEVPNIKDFRPKSSFVLPPPSKGDKVMRVNKERTRILSQSNSIPFFVFTEEYDLTALKKFKDKNFSRLALIVKSVSVALSQFPMMNTIIDPKLGADGYIKDYILKKEHHISIAQSLPEGLALPYIPNVQDLALNEIDSALREVLSPGFKEEKSEISTFTIYHNKYGNKLFPNIIRPQT